MDKENKKPSMKKEKRKNSFRNPISFRLSGSKPTENGSFGPATEELKAAYPLIQNVSFLGLRKDSKKLQGWINFLNPKNCSTTFSLMQKNPIQRSNPKKWEKCVKQSFRQVFQTHLLCLSRGSNQSCRIFQKMCRILIINVFNIF